MDPTQAKIIELLREVHLLAAKEIERLNLRITELENDNRQRPPQAISKPVEKPSTINPAQIKPEPQPRHSEMLNEHEVASFLNISVATVRRWRLFRKGPTFLKIGSAVRYRRRDVELWVESCPG
jgi:predicted DNA-binding transcriptional regulator AlpA